MIVSRMKAGELEAGAWHVVGWRRITDAERMADYPDLTPPNLIDHYPPRKRYRLQDEGHNTPRSPQGRPRHHDRRFRHGLRPGHQ